MQRGFALAGVIGCALFAGIACAQTVYSWKDAAGTTHYSERQPAVKAKLITLHQTAAVKPTAPGTAIKPPSADSTLDKASKDFRRKACATAQGNLKLLSGSGVVVSAGTLSQPVGVLGASKLSDAQRQAAKIQAEANIHSYCDRG